eukprot:3151947-Amphidinium_carterae.1
MPLNHRFVGIIDYRVLVNMSEVPPGKRTRFDVKDAKGLRMKGRDAVVGEGCLLRRVIIAMASCAQTQQRSAMVEERVVAPTREALYSLHTMTSCCLLPIAWHRHLLVPLHCSGCPSHALVKTSWSSLWKPCWQLGCAMAQ